MSRAIAVSMRPVPTPTPEARVPRAVARHAAYALLALFFAFANLRLIVLLMPKAFVLSADVGEGVVRGEPLWRVYQSRILAPYLVHALGAFAPLGVAYVWFAIGALFAAGFIVLALTDRLRDRDRPPVVAFLVHQVAFLFLLPCIWLYPWDLLALPLFAAFHYRVLARPGRIGLLLLFAVAVLNHEIALFMAAWLVLDPVVRYAAARRSRARSPAARFDWPTAALGIAAMIAGAAAVELLRRALLVREMPPSGGLPPHVVYGRSVHLAWAQNWDTLASSFRLSVPEAFAFLIPLFLLAVLGLAIRLVALDWVRYGALAAITVGMVVSLLLFGLVFETRVLMPLVPFVAMHASAAFPRRG